jgi:hypothetical protein
MELAMMPSRNTLRVLRRLAEELGVYSTYMQLDLALHRACEGDVVLVDSVKRALAGHVESGQTPLQAVRDAIDELVRRGNAGP